MERERLNQPVRAVERALSIMEAFTRGQRELTLTQIADFTSLNPSTALRLLNTLIPGGYIVFNRKGKIYSLGNKLSELGGLVLQDFPIRQIAAPYLDVLEKEIKCILLLSVKKGDEIIYIEKRENFSPIRIWSRVGTRRKPTFGIMSQVFLSFETESELDRILLKYPPEKMTEKTVTDPEQYKKAVAEVKRRGYGIEKGQIITGIAGLAVPVHGRGSNLEAVLAAVVNIDGEKRDPMDIIKKLKITAEQISLKMGPNNNDISRSMVE